MKVFTIVFFLATQLSAAAQSSLPDSSSSPKQRYFLLYHGRQYLNSYGRVDGHPYFGAGTFDTGSVQFNGFLYTDIPLYYELVRDELLTLGADGYTLIVLNAAQIDHFDLPGSHFVYIVKDSSQSDLYNTGFYEQNYLGRDGVFSKHIKYKTEPLTATIKPFFQERNLHFVWHNGNYHLVRRRKDLFRVYNDRRKDIQRLVKEHSLNFKDNFESSLIQTVRLLDQSHP